jgi:acyl-CoA synthetase (AMP-forming)/AMP-acid ligase II
VAPEKIGTLVELLRARSQATRVVEYVFLTDGERKEVRLSHAELDRRARAVAAQLQQVARPGDRALLLYPAGLEFLAGFFGCLYAGLVAVPTYPPDSRQDTRTIPRLLAVVEDCQPTIVLSTSAVQALGREIAERAPLLGSLQWLATDRPVEGAETAWHDPAVSPDHLAFLQYTSGSTGKPKGVMLTHRNAVENQRLIQHGFREDSSDVGIGWLPQIHDMGLIGNLLQSLYVGIPVVMMSPLHFLWRPIRWLRAITTYRGTITGGPNFAYDHCVTRTTPEQREGLDLSSLRLLFSGAEPVRAQSLERFAQVFEPHGLDRRAFFPCYGLAEATLFVSGGPKGVPLRTLSVDARELEHDRLVTVPPTTEGARMLVSSGAVGLDTEVAIVDPATRRPCGPDQVGEIWVANSSVGSGYWNQPQLSAEVFQAELEGEGGRRFLRTGDLGFLQGDQLFVTGRLKDLIIIRGANYYPQDIEATVAGCHQGMRPDCGAAFSVLVDGEERLVIVQEVDRRHQRARRAGAAERRESEPPPGNDPLEPGAFDLEEAYRAVRKAVMQAHALNVHAIRFVRPGTVPKTTSGKVQRRACREAFLENKLELID